MPVKQMTATGRGGNRKLRKGENMDIKRIEDKALENIVSISLGLPSILLAIFWSLLSNFLPEAVKTTN